MLFRCTARLVIFISTGAAAVLSGGCSTEHFKAEADREVYKIIDNKWHPDFGQKTNYVISDVQAAGADVQIAPSAPESGVISLAQAVALATADNRNYSKQKEELYQAALGLSSERHNYARQWFGFIGGKYARTGENEDVSLYTGEKGPGNTQDKDLGFDHRQLLAGGLEISTALAVDWFRFLTGDPRTSLGSVLTASVAVPLLGASRGKVDLENLTQAEREVLYRIRSFNRYRKEFVVSIVAEYYGVLQKRDAVTNAENNYKMVAESKERLEWEAKAGRKTLFEVDQAQQRVLTARDNYVSAVQSYQQQLDAFKLQLALPTDADIELDQNELGALEKTGVSEPDYTVVEAIETALLERLDLANTADRIDDVVRKVILAQEGLGPQLDLTGDLNVDSTPETDFSRLRFHQGRYGAALEADLPLDRKLQRNAYRGKLIELQQQQRQYEEQLDIIKLQVRDAYRQLKESAQLYQIQQNSVKLAQDRVESTTMLLDAGRTWARDLLEAQDDLLAAQNSLTAALIKHATAKLTFFRDVGILQVRPDGMWQVK